MTRPDPNSKAGQLRHAERTLRSLLRTPKTRGGLIAAVRGGHISRNFVFGWLSEHTRGGLVAKYKSGANVMYQIASKVVAEVPERGEYPAWLDPRWLPVSTGRSVFIDGVGNNKE